MSDINNLNPNIKPIAPADSVSAAKKETPAPAQEASKSPAVPQDFSNPKAEALGRSQVNKTDNVKNDVKFMKENPDAVKSAEKFFDVTYSKLQEEGVPDPYEKAASMATIYAKEITK